MMTELFQQALHINTPWLIKSVDFNADKKRLDIYIDFKKGSTFADPDAASGSEKMYKAYDTVQKTWQHLNFFEYECHLHTRVPRIKRDDGKVRLIPTPWEGKVSGFTLLFEALLIQLCKAMPVHNVSMLTGVSDHKVWRVLDTYIELARKGEDYSDLSIIGMDETSIARGHEYITLFVDLVERKTVHISAGKDNKTVVEFVEELEVKKGDRMAIKQVSCDMSPAFIKGVKENLPEAEITFDKFHIIKLINEAVDQVRREEGRYTPELKGNRYVFLKNNVNLTEKQKEIKEELSLATLNLKSIRALHIREAFQQIYQAESAKKFEGLLNSWYYWATHSQLAPMVKVAKTIKKHWEGILSWKKSQINNGILEGLNSILQAAKRKARGYKIKHFKTITYLLTGKLDFSKINKNCLPT